MVVIRGPHARDRGLALNRGGADRARECWRNVLRGETLGIGSWRQLAQPATLKEALKVGG